MSVALSVAVIGADNEAPKEKKACDATKPGAAEAAKGECPSCPMAKAKKAEAEKAAAEAAKQAEKK